MKRNTLSKAVLAGSIMMVGAQAAVAAPTLGDVLGASGITATGYVDAAYSHFDTNAPALNPFDGPSSNTFNLKQAAITIAKQPAEGFGALVNVTAGSNASTIASTGSNTTNVDVTQAFAQYATGPLTVMGGKFVTLAGAEVIAANANTNISHSIAFFNAIPFSHTGVRLAYVPVNGLTLYAGANNGWDQQQDANKGKTLELGAAWSSDMLSVAAQAYGGQEPAFGGMNAERTLIDVVATFKPIKPLALVLNVDMGKQKDAMAAGKDAKWNAIVGYANYQITDKFRTSLRLEQFDDKDGYKLGLAGGAQKVKEGTLTVGYAPVDSFELRGEIREDKSGQKAFMKDGKATDKQQYFAVEGLYKF